MSDRKKFKNTVVSELNRLSRFVSKSVFVLKELYYYKDRFDEFINSCDFNGSERTYFYSAIYYINSILEENEKSISPFILAEEGFDFVNKELDMLKTGVICSGETKIVWYESKIRDELDKVANNKDESLVKLLVMLSSYYPFSKATRYVFDVVNIRDKSKFCVKKITDWSLTFEYDGETFIVHEDTDDGRSLTLYRKLYTDRGFVLQPIISKPRVKMTDLRFGKFNPYKKGITYSCIDKDKLILCLTYYELVTGYCSKRVSDLRKKNQERESQILALKNLEVKLRNEISNMEE